MSRRGIPRRGRWTIMACAALVVLSATAPEALGPHLVGWRPMSIRPLQGTDSVPEASWQRGQFGPCGHQGRARPAVYEQRPHLRLAFDVLEYYEHAPCAEQAPQPAVGILRVFHGRSAAEEAQDPADEDVRADEHVRGEGKRAGKRGGEVRVDEAPSNQEPASHLVSDPQHRQALPAPGGRTTAGLPESGSGRARRAVGTAVGAPRPTSRWRGADGGSATAHRSGEPAGDPARASGGSRPASRDNSPSASARSRSDSSRMRAPVYRVPMAPPLSPGRSAGYPWVSQSPSWVQANATSTSTAWSGPVAPR